MGLILTLAYAALAALLLNLNLATRFSPLIKTLMILVVSGFYVGAWQGHRALMGWATAAPLPEQFRVHWITIDEPDKSDGAPGGIFFWVRRIDDAGLPMGEPRAHRVEWTEENAQAAEEALARMDEGELLNGRMSRSAVEDEAPTRASDDYAGDPGAAGGEGAAPTFEFVRVPPPALPPKATPEE